MMKFNWKKVTVVVVFPLALYLFLWGTIVVDQAIQRGPASTNSVFGDLGCWQLFKGLATENGQDLLGQTWWYKRFNDLGPDIIKRAKQAKRLPNNHIDVSANQLRRLKKQLPQKVYNKFMNLLGVDRKPHVLISGMEFGNLPSLGAKVQVGGEAVVINDSINNFPRFLDDFGGGTASYVFPGFGGRGSLKATGVGERFAKVKIPMGDTIQEVEFLAFKGPNGGMIYSVEHAAFKQRPATVYTGVKRPKWGGASNVYENGKLVVEDISTNAYTSWPTKVSNYYEKLYASVADLHLSNEEQKNAIDAVISKLTDKEILDMWTVGPEELFSGRVEWEDFWKEALFAKAQIELKNLIDANVIHLQDYHTALTGMLAKDDTIVTITIHNAGAAYQGRYYTVGYGDGFMKKIPGFKEKIPYAGDKKTVDSFLEMLGLIDQDLNSYVKYLMSPEGSGDVLSLGSINKIAEKNLLGGMPVSEGYAAELKLVAEEIVETITRETGQAPAQKINWWDLPNGGLDALVKNVLDGVVNGLDESRHAMNSGMLKNIDEDIMVGGRKVVKRHGALNFGANLNTVAGKNKVHKNKNILKGIAQRELGLIEDSDSPLFVMVSRFVDQKDPEVVVNNVRHIIQNGGQVIISGEVGDEIGAIAAKRLKELVMLPEMKGKLIFVEGRLQQFGKVMGGADYFFVPSKHEPCGITDIEAMWFGIIPIAKNIGGLNKGSSTLLYNFMDAKNVQGHTFKLRTKIDEAFDLFYNKPEEFKKLRIMGLEQRFPLETQYSRFLENYRSAALYKVFLEAVAEGKNSDEVIQIMDDIFDVLPEDLIANFVRLLELKPSKDTFEKALLKSL